jgi:hypothetical protein
LKTLFNVIRPKKDQIKKWKKSKDKIERKRKRKRKRKEVQWNTIKKPNWKPYPMELDPKS